jgi:large repetitive protein
LRPQSPVSWVSLMPSGYPMAAIPSSLTNFIFESKAVVSQDFCLKMDATFDILDTICVGTTLFPNILDTSGGFKHSWIADNFVSFELAPTILFPKSGFIRVKHQVYNQFCEDTTSRLVRVLDAPKISFGDTIVCGAAVLKLDLTDSSTERYFLNGNAVSPIIEIQNSGVFSLKLENKSCFSEKDFTVKIVNFDPPQLVFDSIACQNEPISVVLKGDFENYFLDKKAATDTFLIVDGQRHFFTANYIFDHDCAIDGDFKITRNRCKSEDLIFVPNIFTPNGDGENDVFQLFPSEKAQILALKIFDRWGELVFSQKNVAPAWDGFFREKLVETGVFTFTVEFLDLRDLSRHLLAGDFLVVR